MHRQLLGNRAPYVPQSTPLPLENGGHGATTPEEAMTNLAGIHVSQVGTEPGQLAGLDENGTLPSTVFASGGSARGLSIDGPKTLVFGQESTYLITNLDQSSAVAVSVSAGSVTQVGDKLIITAPAEGEYVDLTLGIRQIRIPLTSGYIEKPTILGVTKNNATPGEVLLQASTFYSEPEVIGDYNAVNVASYPYTLLSDTSSFEISGRCGDNGTAFAIYEGVTYSLGKGETRRRIRRNIESTVTFGVTNGGSLLFRELSPLYPHTDTDWEISDTPTFDVVIWGKTSKTGDLTTAIASELPPGQYYVRVRYANRTQPAT